MKTAREEILEKLRNAIHQSPEIPDFEQPVFPPLKNSLDQVFKDSLETINGEVHLFADQNELYQSLKSYLSSYPTEGIFCNEPVIKEKLEKFGIEFQTYSTPDQTVEIAITSCEFLVAQTGSVMVSSAQAGGRQLSVFPDKHIVIADKSQLVANLEDAYSAIQKKYEGNFPSHVALISGPSRTADIEKTLVLGAHGPRELLVLISLNS